MICPPFRPPRHPLPVNRAFVCVLTRAKKRPRAARARAYAAASTRASLSSRLRGEAFICVRIEIVVLPGPDVCFLFKCVILARAYTRARARGILIAGRSQVPSDRHRDDDGLSHYLISARRYDLILCAGNYSDRDANRAHSYDTFNMRKRFQVGTNSLWILAGRRRGRGGEGGRCFVL